MSLAVCRIDNRPYCYIERNKMKIHSFFTWGGRKDSHTLADSLISFMLVFCTMECLYMIYGYAPFGDRSLAWSDANIQYLDLFAYLKDVLEGKNNIAQTFSSFLGGNNIGTFSYYLSSPFNLLVVFFAKSALHDFLDLLVALKTATAAATFCIFLHARFRQHMESGRGRGMGILLAVAYALSQYNIAQSSNIMWLDGVYMLPLILLGVYRIVQNSSGWGLSVSVSLSILFGWYTGGINCLFSGLWLCFEIALRICGEKQVDLAETLAQGCRYCVRYAFSMAAGVLSSMTLFWPSVLAMGNSKRGGLEFGRLKDFSFIGPLPSVLQGYALGAKSSYGNVSLYCGSLALVGCIACFVSKNIAVKIKAAFGTMCGGVLLLFYWNPLYTTFSLFKKVDSYWYRYSYVGIFAVLFLAAYFYITETSEDDRKHLWKNGLWAGGILVFLDYLKPAQDRKLTYYTAAAIALTAAILALAWSCGNRQYIRKAVYGVLGILALFELAYGTKLQMYHYHASDVETYREYVSGTGMDIENICLREGENAFRISQTSTRNHNKDINRTANYNEALAFGYASVAGYVSSPDDRQLELLNRIGYRKEGDRMTVVNTCQIGADSLLGVKYVLSVYPVNGLVESDRLAGHGDRKIYENPYWLPFAFTCDGKVWSEEGDMNPFEYQNRLYSQLAGREMELYKPLKYVKSQNGPGEPYVYSIEIPAGNYAVYGNIPWRKTMDALMNVNHVYDMAYAKWLSPSVFYIPTEAGEGSGGQAFIELKADDYEGLAHGEEQFYALNLEILQEASVLMRGRSADRAFVRNGEAVFEVETDRETSLYVSIPYDTGWTVTNNGETVETGLFADCMYLIPLDKGQNIIKMTYRLPGLTAGVIGTAIGILLTFGMFLEEKRRSKGMPTDYSPGQEW